MHGCASHVYMPESSLHKEKFLTNKLCCPIYCISHVGVHHMCMPESSLHKEKFLTNKLWCPILFIVYHTWVRHHMCVCLKVPYIRRNSLQIKILVSALCIIIYMHACMCMGVHASHVCICSESSLHKEKFLTMV